MISDVRESTCPACHLARLIPTSTVLYTCPCGVIVTCQRLNPDFPITADDRDFLRAIRVAAR